MAKSPKIPSAKRVAVPKLRANAKTKKIASPKGPAAQRRANTKQAKVVAMLRRPGGATIADLAKATGWQHHTVRGVISGALKKKLGLAVLSEMAEGEDRVYRLP